MNNEIFFIQLNNYVRPKLVENKSKNWVLNGRNNSFYKDIIDRRNGSPTNSAIISTFCDLIYGNGLRAKNAKDNITDWVRLNQILKPNDLRNIINDFYLFGEASFQVVKAKDKKNLGAIYHIAKDKVVPSIEDEEGNINSYWFSRDWGKLTTNQPIEFKAFGTSNDSIEIYNISPYKAGKEYFSDPDYLAGLPYAQMEEEIANLYINSIKNGLSAGYIINVPDGLTKTPEEKEAFQKKVKDKLTGSVNANNFIISFNGRDAEITITPFPVNENVHKQWQYLTEESRQQLFTAHKVVSPMLFGVKDSTGFGNNADELDTAEKQIMKRVIQPKQRFILDALNEVLISYDINLDLYLAPLTEEVTQVALKYDKKKNDLIDLGEDEDLDNYEIVDENEVDYEEEINLASTGVANPNAKSEQDTNDILIRYRYVGNKSPQREFCQKMMSANKIYRKEDIIAMENKPVNAGWGPNGANTYSIWLYKGGGNCHHKWNRVIYVKKGVKIDVNSPLAEVISTSQARREGKKIPANENEVSIEPRNLPNNGFLKKR